MPIFSAIAGAAASAGINKLIGSSGDGQLPPEPQQQNLVGRGINAIGDSAVDAVGQRAADKFANPARQGKNDKAYRDASYPGTNPYEQLGSGVGGPQAAAGVNAISKKRELANQKSLQQEQLTVEREKIAASIEVARISAGATTTAAATPYENPTAKKWGDTFNTLRAAQTNSERERKANLASENLLIQAQTGVENNRKAYIDAQTALEKAKLSPAVLEQRIATLIMQSPNAVEELGQARITKQYASSVTAVMINAAMHQFGDSRGQAAVKVAAALAAAGIIHTVGGILGRFPIRGGRGSPHQQQSGHKFPPASGRPITSSTRPRRDSPTIATPPLHKAQITHPKPPKQHGPNPTGHIRRQTKPPNAALRKTLERAGF